MVVFALVTSVLLASPGFDRPPKGCVDMDDPRIQDERDPRRRKYKIEICCLAPDDPRAQNPDDPRRKTYRAYEVRVCGPDVRALTVASLKRHALALERTELSFELLARDGSKQTLAARAEVTRDRKRSGVRSSLAFGAGALDGAVVSCEGASQLVSLPGFGAPRAPSLGDRFADTDFAFADLLPIDPSRFDYYYRETEGVGEDAVFVYSAFPREEMGADYPYRGQRIWMRARDLVVVKVRMFDRADHPWKEMRFEEVVSVAPGVARANRVVVEDLQRHHRTTVRVLRRAIER